MTEVVYAASPELAMQFSIPFHHGEIGLLLEQTDQGLQLRDLREHAPGPMYADFFSTEIARRRKAGRKLPLARAIGIKAGKPLPSVLDATAGLGRDAYSIAALGCEVTAVERSAIIAALLQSAMDRKPDEAVRRIHLVIGDAVEVMASLSDEQRPDVVYLDPMFPERSKTALVKKEMQYFHALLGDESDGPQLFEPAVECAKQRVVVKRPARAPRLVDAPDPNHSIEGKTVRFDVYLAEAEPRG